MQSIGYIVRRYVGASDRVSTGPAAATLVFVAVRAAAVIRFTAVTYVVVQIAIWRSFYAPETWRLAGPAVAIVWSAAFLIWLAVRRQLATWLFVADFTVLVALALSSAWWLPPQMRGDTASWLYVLIIAQSVFPLWRARLAVSAPLVASSGVAYFAGAVFLSPALPANSAPGVATALVFLRATIAWIGYRMLDRRAVDADTALAAADTAEHEQYIALRRHMERREHDRLVHDTVLNTLTALARLGTGAGPRGRESDLNEVIGRCRHDVALMEYALGGSSDADLAAQERNPNARVRVAVEAVALEMRARGLDVHVQATGARDGQASDTDPPARVAVPVVAAVMRALREALTNVARHAGTGEAWVEVCLPEAGTGRPEGGGWLTVIVRDHGIGFDPGNVAPDRLGISRSIIERIADCGGATWVRSSPGNGTTVTLRAPARADVLRSPHTPAPPRAPATQEAPVPPRVPADARSRSRGAR